MPRKKVRSLLLKILGALVFFLVSAYALFLSFGYHYDLKERDVKKTSIIDLASGLKEVQVYLDGKLVKGLDVPYQIKDVEPGSYKLVVKKPFFLDWQRVLKVQADIVTKVSDILLVPQDLGVFRKELIRFVDDARFYFGENLILVLRPQQNYLTIITLDDKGQIKEDEMKLNSSDVDTIDVFSGKRFVLHDRSGGLFLVRFSQGSTTPFVLPKDVTHFTISPFSDTAYYLQKGALFRVHLDQLNLVVTKDNVAVKIRDQVTQFTLTESGIFALSPAGNVSYSNNDGNDVITYSDVGGPFVNLQYVVGKNYGYLILRTAAKNSQRFVYFVNSQKKLKIVTENLKDSLIFNRLDQMMYMNTEGAVFAHDPRLEVKSFLGHLKPEVRLISWFDDLHFLYQDDDLRLTDLAFSNVYSMGFAQKEARFFVKDRALFYLIGNELKVLDWITR